MIPKKSGQTRNPFTHVCDRDTATGDELFGSTVTGVDFADARNDSGIARPRPAIQDIRPRKEMHYAAFFFLAE